MSEPVNVMMQSPAEREAAKTRAERAEDVAYTINHAISCGTNDIFIAPTISALFGVNIGCNDPTHNHSAHDDHDHDHHDHAHDAHDHHDHHAHAEPHAHPHAPQPGKFNWKLYRTEAFHYLKGEIYGDVLAVPLAIITQRLFPGFTDAIGKLMEPIVGPFFRRGANAAAKKQGARDGLEGDAPEIVANAEAMYQSEMRHLSLVMPWNVYAFVIGAGIQKKLGHEIPLKDILFRKSVGAIISNTVVLGTRALAPNVAQRWDAMNGEHIIAPVSNFVSGVVGLKQPETQPWAARMERAPANDTNIARTL